MRSPLRKPLCLLVALFALSLASVHAQPVVTGSVFPDPLGFGQNVIVGSGGSPGTLTISGGIGMTNTSTIIGDNADDSVLTVTGTGSTLTNNGTLYVGYLTSGSSSSNNTMTISAGGKVTSSFSIIGYHANNSAVTVSGMGSTWTTTNAGSALSVGSSGGLNNTLTVEDSALVSVGNGLSFGDASNFLRLDGGFVALPGDQTTVVNTFLTNGNIQVWDSGSWVTATGNPLFSFAYFSDATSAFNATGYSGLGGYTILGAAAIPEPSTYALVAGVLGLGLAALSRRAGRRSIRALECGDVSPL